MIYLFIVSLLWAFSFGLIKTSLAGIDPFFVATVRLAIAALVFIPFFRPRLSSRKITTGLLLSGAVQFGGMYVFYLYAFKFLQAYEVALFTILTPLYVVLIDDLLRKQINWINLGTAALAICGTWIVEGAAIPKNSLLAGFLLVQASNLCFALGQLCYRRIMEGAQVSDRNIFVYAYLGGVVAAGAMALLFTNWKSLAVSEDQWLTLFYLGAIASGLGFFLWNTGARRVETGTLAIFNDLKVPLAVAVSLVFFGEKTNLLHLAIGGGICAAALLLNEREAKKTASLPMVPAKTDL